MVDKASIGNAKPKIDKRGRLRIYLGFAPGVGKTHKMLQEALYLKRQNYNVVIGWLEENYREEIKVMARDFDEIPPLSIDYRESSFREMDVVKIVSLRPYLVLVDELAHTNIPGSKFAKRYQDVEYLRDNGINVMTTLNIHHVEGVKNAAARITGMDVTETVPDWVLDSAEEVELVDVSAQVLKQRLIEGKIFPPNDINRNTFGMFSANRLLALRELALRYIADEVDERLEDYKAKKGIFNQVKVNERVLVCVNSPATAKRLIAIGANIANRMMAQLLVLFIRVDTNLADKEVDFEISQNYTTGNAKLFQEITEKYEGIFIKAKVGSKSQIPKGIIRIIEEKKVTQVIFGESGIPRWKEIVEGSIINKILTKVRNVDVLVAGNRENMPSRNVNIGVEKERPVVEKGKFKIYIGASAGVGKSVAMLKEAHELSDKGIDVVIGFIETHKRQETADFIGNLEIIPLKHMTYRGVDMQELDVQKIIERKPQVVLIDELAHTNVPGSRNEKRYQDIMEILEAGIQVVTAVNIQHIESLNDIVEDVTGVTIRETVPDAVIARADELVMIDVTPENLRARLRTGKIYTPEKVEQALNSFFRKENLQALRELALRELAQDVDDEIKIEDSTIRNEENILVCVRARAEDDRLIRRGFKIAQRFKAKLYVLHIIDGHRYSMAESQQLDILKGLAERLGADFIIERVSKKRQLRYVILDYIAREKITKLILGQSIRNRQEEILHGSIVNFLLRKTSGIDIHIVAD